MDRAVRRQLLQVLFREFHEELTAQETLLLLPMPRGAAARAERKTQLAAGLARLEHLLVRTRELEQDGGGRASPIQG